MTSGPQILLHRTRFAYGAQVVVDHVSLAVNAGELICVVGKNGAGKTTLLRLLGGLLSPTSGSVTVAGVHPSAVPRAQLARTLCFVPQSYRPAFPFTVTEIVLMGRYPHARRSALALESSEDLELAAAAMEECDVRHLADRRFDTLSGGEQRRAVLAQSIAQRTPVVLLDEPTASLDPSHALAVMQTLRRACGERQTTAVVVTHDLSLAARFADRVAVLDAGGLIGYEPPEVVFADRAVEQAFGVPLYTATVPSTGARFVVPR